MPKPIDRGCKVRLKNTPIEGVVVGLYRQNMGMKDNERTYEYLARLDNGQIWKTCQLEVIE
jgi:hypothetical protein